MTNARASKTAREKSAEMRAQAARQDARKKNLLVLSAILAVLVVAVGATVLVRTMSHQKAVETAATEKPPAGLTPGNGFVVGNADAKVTITAYEDFQCPACAQFEKANREQIDAWVKAGTVKVEYRPIAFLDEASSTSYSTRSLMAAAAVIDSSPTAFQQFHTLLFENQPAEGGEGLPDGTLVDLAKQAGADGAAVQAALTNGTYKGWTAKVTDAFSKAGFNSTPTIVVNGKKVDSYAPEVLKAAVDAALKG